MGTGTRTLASQLSPLQSATRLVAGALSRSGSVALHVRGGGGIGKRATNATPADDRLLSPAFPRVARVEYRREYLTGGAGCGCAAGAGDRASQRRDRNSTI